MIHTHRPLFANTYSAVYDIVITGGLVYDGTGAKPVRADVAIIDGRVALIGDVKGSGHVMCVTSPSLLLLPCCRWRAYLGCLTLAGVYRYDATGKIVAPGLVDLHTHYDAEARTSFPCPPPAPHTSC